MKPIDEDTLSLRACVVEHSRNMCSMDSDSHLHRMHHVGPKIAICVRCSPVGTMSLRMHQKKSLVCGGAVSFQMYLHQFMIYVGLL